MRTFIQVCMNVSQVVKPPKVSGEYSQKFLTGRKVSEFLVNLGSYRSLNRLHFAYIQLVNVFVLILDQGLHSVHA